MTHSRMSPVNSGTQFFLRMALALALAVGPGCANLGKVTFKKNRPPRATAAPKPLLIGSIALVNEGSHFVLIDNGDLAAPSPGETLKTYTGQAPSGELLSTAMTRRPYLIADIKSGEPKKGDRVMLPVAENRPNPKVKMIDNVPVARAHAVAPPPEETPPPKKKKPFWKLW